MSASALGLGCLEPSRRPLPEQSLTLSPMHPFGTSATLACVPVLGFISFLFLFHCDIATGFPWPLVFYYSTFSMCVCTCVFVCVCLCLHATEKITEVHGPEARKVGVTTSNSGRALWGLSHWEQMRRSQDVSEIFLLISAGLGCARLMQEGTLIP